MRSVSLSWVKIFRAKFEGGIAVVVELDETVVVSVESRVVESGNATLVRATDVDCASVTVSTVVTGSVVGAKVVGSSDVETIE